jgi:hypothetical protein
MERKFITDELIKVANALDEMGLTKEANSLDKIARKIVAEVREFALEGYQQDILTYKSLINIFQSTSDPTYKKEYAQEATNFLRNVQKADYKMYTNEQKSAFMDQAAAIRNSIYGNLNDKALNDKLAMAMKTGPFEIENGVITSSFTNVSEFTDFWMQQVQQQFDIYNNSNIAKWLSSKFLIYKKQILANNAKYKAEQQAKEPNWWQKTFQGKK